MQQENMPLNGPPNIPARPSPDKPPQKKRFRFSSKTLGLVLLSFVAGILGSWAALSSGFIQPNTEQSISENREQFVLQEGEIIADVAEKVAPSVVSIVAAASNSTPFGDIPVQSSGTGIIISSNGYIITNKHVIPENVSNVSIVRSDGTVVEGVTVVGRDPLNDIAFLKINNASDLPAAELGDSSKVTIGQGVVAIGNALGRFQNTVTSGIISGIGRPITAGVGADAERLEDLFQTDAAINPGNSGGPLVSLDGKVIGINTAIAEEAEGIGFAIPINATKGLIKTVTSSGEVSRAYLGVRYIGVNAVVAEERNLAVKQGALISSGEGQDPIVDGGPADKAGLRANDIITKVNGAAITDRQSLAGLLSQYVPGDTVTLTVVRDSDTEQVKVELEKLQE